MRTLAAVALFALVAGGCNKTAFPDTAKGGEMPRSIIDPYLKIQAALADDSVEGVRQNAGDLTTAAAALGAPAMKIDTSAPQLPSPSMMLASSDTCPSRSGYPARPTLWFFKSASGTRAPASTASSARPPTPSTAHAARFAATPKSQVDTTRGAIARAPRDVTAVAEPAMASAGSPRKAALRNVLRSIMFVTE